MNVTIRSDDCCVFIVDQATGQPIVEIIGDTMPMKENAAIRFIAAMDMLEAANAA
jgi:hypothetical protein